MTRLYRTHTSYGQHNWLYQTWEKNTCLHVWSLNTILVDNEYCTNVPTTVLVLNSNWRSQHSHTASSQEPWQPCLRNAQKSRHTEIKQYVFHIICSLIRMLTVSKLYITSLYGLFVNEFVLYLQTSLAVNDQSLVEFSL